jgi:hypothetical protein
MSKRMQVLIDDKEYALIRRAAGRRGQTLAEWVREALREARLRQPTRPTERKLGVIRVAASHEGPTADIEQMLAEIERGYVDGAAR